MLICAVLFLAVTNCAVNNVKGVATLHGTGTAGYWQSLSWASATTCGAALCSAYLAGDLLIAFTGKGLVLADSEKLCANSVLYALTRSRP